MEEMEKKAAELRNEIEAAKKVATEAKTAMEEMKDATKTELEDAKSNIEKLDKSINEMNEKLKTIVSKSEPADFGTELKRVVNSEAFKAEMEELKEGKRVRTSAFEIKVDPTSVVTTGLTGDVNRTMPSTTIYSQGYEPNKFIAACTPVTIPQDKNRVMWMDGAYFSNVGYVGEMSPIATGDGASVVEKYREIAKIAAKLPFSQEVASDMNYFVTWAQSMALKAVLNDLDTKIIKGDGADGGGNTKHVYGLSTQGATPFNAATAGLTASLEDANLADLILACQTQINIQSKGQYVGTIAFVHPSNTTKLRSLKNKIADYLNILPNGQMQVRGCTIVETAKMTTDELLVCDPTTLWLYQKDSIKMEIERVASTDSYVLYLRWRGNVVVPTYAKLGNVWCSSIATAIASVTKASSPIPVVEVTTAAPTTIAPTTTVG